MKIKEEPIEVKKEPLDITDDPLAGTSGENESMIQIEDQIKVEVKSEPKEPPSFNLDEDVELAEVDDFISDDPGSEEEESDEDWNKSSKNLGPKTKTRGNVQFFSF